MMKGHLICALCSAGVFLCLPFCIVTFASADSSMIFCMLLFYAINPITVTSLGAFAGRNIKAMWFWPLLFSMLFLLGTWTFLDGGQTDFLLYAGGYLLIGYTSCFIATVCSRKNVDERGIQ